MDSGILLLIGLGFVIGVALFMMLPRLTGTNTGEASNPPNIDTAVGTGQTQGHTITDQPDDLPGHKTAGNTPEPDTSEYAVEQPEYFETGKHDDERS